LIEERSSAGLIRLAQEGRQFEMTFIDGGHLFDTVLLDFTLSAELCPVGGYVIFDDLWMPAIRKVDAFVRANRADFTSVSTPIKNIAVFRRIATDAREWRHFVKFS
jgi:hypothetical protein